MLAPQSQQVMVQQAPAQAIVPIQGQAVVPIQVPANFQMMPSMLSPGAAQPMMVPTVLAQPVAAQPLLAQPSVQQFAPALNPATLQEFYRQIEALKAALDAGQSALGYGK
jgi:hypothetical protein